jgi:hypothetical protein
MLGEPDGGSEVPRFPAAIEAGAVFLRGAKARSGGSIGAVAGVRRWSRVLLVVLVFAAPAGEAQQADSFNAEWARVTSGGQSSSNGEFSADGTIGVPEADPDSANADVYTAVSGLRPGFLPNLVDTRANAIFVDDYE